MAGYSWYGDDELHALIDRYLSRAGDASTAARKLKLWLGSAPSRSGGDLSREQHHEQGEQIWLTRPEAAAYIGVSSKTLANWAGDPQGPPFRRKGGVRYQKSLLDDWLARNVR